jgi:hypothetical protein
MTEKFILHHIKQQKSDGSVKERTVLEPSDEVRRVHGEMLRLLHNFDILSPHATGSVPGMTLLDNVLPHRQHDNFYLLDLEDAYQHVDIDSLREVMSPPRVPIRYAEEVQDFITEWATDDRVPGLPLGPPASPFLFNASCLPLDRALAEVCQDNGITYTRFIDDLTFSSNYKFGPKTRKKVRSVIENHPGAIINPTKTKRHSLGRGAVTITGISIYPDRHVSPSPAVLQAANDALREVEGLVAGGHIIIGEDIARLQGYNNVLSVMTLRATPTVQKLKREFERVIELAEAVCIRDEL